MLSLRLGKKEQQLLCETLSIHNHFKLRHPPFEARDALSDKMIHDMNVSCTLPVVT